MLIDHALHFIAMEII